MQARVTNRHLTLGTAALLLSALALGAEVRCSEAGAQRTSLSGLEDQIAAVTARVAELELQAASKPALARYNTDALDMQMSGTPFPLAESRAFQIDIPEELCEPGVFELVVGSSSAAVIWDGGGSGLIAPLLLEVGLEASVLDGGGVVERVLFSGALAGAEMRRPVGTDSGRSSSTLSLPFELGPENCVSGVSLEIVSSISISGSGGCCNYAASFTLDDIALLKY